MRIIFQTIIALMFILPFKAISQNYPHYTMFMYNKMIYNPGYAGNKNLVSINGAYRQQWTGLEGAPRNINVTIDGPIGNYMKAFRPAAIGLGINTEKIGVTDNTNIMGYYAYRVPVKNTVLSFGLQFGASVYNARYSELNIRHQQDQTLVANVNNAILPNFGPGVYWSGENFYVGLSVPNLLENYYDKNNNNVVLVNDGGKQVRSYFLSGGYVFDVTDNVRILPQILARYTGNGEYKLPLNSDFNLSFIFFDRIMLGGTYRTDNSLSAIVHIQATKYTNIGYSYDYSTTGLNGYNRGSHELVLGFDLIRDNNRYTNPRFIRPF